MARVIFKSQIEDLLAELGKNQAVMAPVHPDGEAYDSVVFKKYEKGDNLAIPYGTTILPPKQFTLPPKEGLFSFVSEKITSPNHEKMAIFGLGLHDLVGLNRLDKIFATNISDEPYKNRRDKITVIGLDRFSPPAGIDYDLYLMKIGPEVYAGFAGSKVGRDLLKSKHFKTKTIKIPNVRLTGDNLLANPNLSDAIKNSKNHPIWNELAESCFGCGICSYVCPLCYCFETNDEFNKPGTKDGARYRTWDSCLLPHFADSNAGNFRKELSDRLYNWYFHKFVRMPKEVGFNGCVDCNRCVIYCPAKINYRKVLQTVLSDYEKKKKGSRRSETRQLTKGKIS